MTKKSMVYTKTGDKGKTGLIGGTRVYKSDTRLDAYGTVDELNSFIGLIRSYDIDEDIVAYIIEIQKKLFVIGGYLATDQSRMKVQNTTTIFPEDIDTIENKIDLLDADLTPMTHFVLPGGNLLISYCHVARTVCRRAERVIVKMAEDYPVEELVVRYINRLSDYLFVLGRKLCQDESFEEIKWTPS